MKKMDDTASVLEPIAKRVMTLVQIERARAVAQFANRKVHPITLQPLKSDDVDFDIPPGVTASQLAHLERKVERPLPRDLVMWLKLTNGPSGFFGVESKRPTDDMLSFLDTHPGWRKRGLIPVARDLSGCLYAQSVNDHSEVGCPIVFMDLPDDTGEIKYVCASNMIKFAEFMMRYWLRHESEIGKGIEKWPYDRAFTISEDPHLESVRGLPFAWTS
jgi:hypothetical protein